MSNVKVEASVNNDYFINLTENFSYNPNSTCPFVSLTMLLSYYDTYKNDDIIPEQYDAVSDRLGSSPGVYRETVEGQYHSEYVEELIGMKDYSLQGLLMYIADICGCDLRNIDNDDRVLILKHYFSNYTDFEFGVDYTFNYLTIKESPVEERVTEDDVLQLVKDEIDADRPVIFCYGFENYSNNYDIGEHAAVAYEYNIVIEEDEESNESNIREELFVHLGDKMLSRYFHYNVMDYDVLMKKSVFSINFTDNVEHKHSNNYAIDDDDYHHLLQCPCGYYTYETHNTIVTETGEPRCKSCNKGFSSNPSFDIMLDPSNDSLCGTHVSIYGGSLNSTDIVVGYTRIAYVIGGSEVSRLDYNWHSSNTDICEVTKYGTILAKDAGTAYIIASSKDVPFKFDIISVTVLEDTTAETKYISMTTDIRTPNELNGTEVRLNNGNANEFSVHSGFTRALCFSLSNAYPSIDDFTWQSSNSCLQLLPGGYVKANEVEEETTVYVYGYSKYNTNIMAVMTFTVIPYEEGE